MAAKALMTVLFGGIFGITFIVIGVRRLLQARSGKQPVDSIVWGTVGILIGFAFFYGAYWIMTPAPDGSPDTPFDVHSHP